MFWSRLLVPCLGEDSIATLFVQDGAMKGYFCTSGLLCSQKKAHRTAVCVESELVEGVSCELRVLCVRDLYSGPEAVDMREHNETLTWMPFLETVRWLGQLAPSQAASPAMRSSLAENGSEVIGRNALYIHTHADP
eukprot:4795191-Amphidinium_carterae.1